MKFVTFEEGDLVWFVKSDGRAKATGGVHLPNPTMELSAEDVRFCFPHILEEAKNRGLKREA